MVVIYNKEVTYILAFFFGPGRAGPSWVELERFRPALVPFASLLSVPLTAFVGVPVSSSFFSRGRGVLDDVPSSTLWVMGLALDSPAGYLDNADDGNRNITILV